jgi:hypothetical protein
MEYREPSRCLHDRVVVARRCPCGSCRAFGRTCLVAGRMDRRRGRRNRLRPCAHSVDLFARASGTSFRAGEAPPARVPGAAREPRLRPRRGPRSRSTGHLYGSGHWSQRDGGPSGQTGPGGNGPGPYATYAHGARSRGGPCSAQDGPAEAVEGIRGRGFRAGSRPRCPSHRHRRGRRHRSQNSISTGDRVVAGQVGPSRGALRRPLVRGCRTSPHEQRSADSRPRTALTKREKYPRSTPRPAGDFRCHSEPS